MNELNEKKIRVKRKSLKKKCRREEMAMLSFLAKNRKIKKFGKEFLVAYQQHRDDVVANYQRKEHHKQNVKRTVDKHRKLTKLAKNDHKTDQKAIQERHEHKPRDIIRHRVHPKDRQPLPQLILLFLDKLRRKQQKRSQNRHREPSLPIHARGVETAHKFVLSLRKILNRKIMLDFWVFGDVLAFEDPVADGVLDHPRGPDSLHADADRRVDIVQKVAVD